MRKNNVPESAPMLVGEPVWVGVAYHDGPPEIHFAGRRWQRGAGQLLTLEEMESLRQRRDFSAYRFTEQLSEE